MPSVAAGTPWTAYGVDSGPGIIITIAADNSISRASTGQGPYDGQDDTYIGVVNNSTTTVGSIRVSAPSSDSVFAFDGDGIQAYYTSPPPLTGGYEGPDNSFSNITDDGTTAMGTVNFTGGLAGGQQTYFSLEGAITASLTNLPPPPPAPVQPTCNCGCIDSPGDLVVTPALEMGPQPKRSSPEPVQYSNGVVTIAETDVRSTAFGFPWGQTRSWTNGSNAAFGDNGSGWVTTQTPTLVQADGATSNTLFVINNGTSAEYFDLNSGTYNTRFDDPSTMVYNSTPDTYSVSDGEGDRIVFSGFGSTWSGAKKGEFLRA